MEPWHGAKLPPSDPTPIQAEQVLTRCACKAHTPTCIVPPRTSESEGISQLSRFFNEIASRPEYPCSRSRGHSVWIKHLDLKVEAAARSGL